LKKGGGGVELVRGPAASQSQEVEKQEQMEMSGSFYCPRTTFLGEKEAHQGAKGKR
jgi:hypothetical protein